MALPPHACPKQISIHVERESNPITLNTFKSKVTRLIRLAMYSAVLVVQIR